MRKRKRDWPQRVFKYWARPTEAAGNFPPAFWHQVRAQQQLWNKLVDLRNKAKTEMAEWSDAEKKVRWTQLNTELEEAVRDSGLDWESGPDILDRFKAACPTKKNPKGDPQRQNRIEKINIIHRFTGGGAPVAQLFSKTAKRIRIGGIPAFAWEDEKRVNKQRRFTRGQWGLPAYNGEEAWFVFDILMHRPLPLGAFVKRVAWTGLLHRIHGWQWALCITVEEEPAQRTYRRDNEVTCGLDLGWRIMAEGAYIRIGMIVDEEDRAIELRLPLSWTNADQRKHHVRLQTNGATYQPHENWRDVIEIDTLIGNATEGCKEQLRSLLPKLPSGFAQMRQRGLFDLMDNLSSHAGTKPQEQETSKVLTVWRDENERLRELKALATDKAIRQRRAMYRVLASWLTETYQSISWEGDLSIKEMAEMDNGDNYALDASMRYRHIAAIGELRLYIQQAAKKNGRELLAAPAAGSTATCWQCGGAIVVGSSLMLTCENRHAEDQDVNAARNLRDFSQTSGDYQQKGELRKYDQQRMRQPLEIPWHLRTVVVSCTADVPS